MAKTYTAKDITALEGLDGVRAKSAFYLGSPPNQHGLFQIIKELVDNAADEAINGYSKVVGFASDGDFWYVWDEGRGIPVETHPTFKKQKLNTFEVILTKLHAGGKLNKEQKGYEKGGRGTHGVGASVTNALSSYLLVNVFRDGKWHSQEYSKGKPKNNVTKVAKPFKIPGLKKQPKCGSLFKFQPDPTIFKKSKLDYVHLADWMDTQAYIHAGISFIYVKDGEETVFLQKDGLKAFIADTMEEVKAEAVGKVFTFQGDVSDVALQWSTYTEEYVYTYVNGSITEQGGTHLLGLQRAVTDALKPYKGARSEYRADDLRSGLIGGLNVAVSSPEFDNQLKDKLVSADTTKLVYNEVFPELEKFFAANKSLAKLIIKRASEVREALDQLKVSKKAAAELKTSGSRRPTVSPDKHARCSSRNPEEIELFIVEGDSAGGGCNKARDRTYQEVLKLRGKILNVYKAKAEKVYDNVEIMNILKASGFDPNAKNPIANLRVGRLIFLADPDPDGCHINVLGLSLLYAQMPEAFDLGMVYLVDAPLFKGRYKDVIHYGDTIQAVREKFPKGAAAEITRMKGWGEANPEDLVHIAFGPERKLIQVTPPKSKEARQEFIDLMSDATEPRLKFMGLA